MVITILSSITVLASVGIVYVTRQAKRRTLTEINAAVIKSEAMLSEMRAMRGVAPEAAPLQARGCVEEVADNSISWIADAIFDVAQESKAQAVVLQREAEEAQYVRDQLVSVLSIRGSGVERMTDVDGRWLLDRDTRLASSFRTSRRRERGIPQSSELPSWSISLH